ncbi:hypothetical protein AGMMS49579_01500 [Spirochaetia bacterium]|nr:hypothetical protein AGMMS49579_01500 [Spirochaetia bacterium]
MANELQTYYTYCPLEKSAECYFSILTVPNLRYICTYNNFEFCWFYIKTENQPYCIPELEINYDSITAVPHKVYDEINGKFTDIYTCLNSPRYILSTHTFIGENGPKCVIMYGKYRPKMIKYLNPFTLKFNSELQLKKNRKIYSIKPYYIGEAYQCFVVWKKCPCLLKLSSIQKFCSIPCNEQLCLICGKYYNKPDDIEVPEGKNGTSTCAVCLKNKTNMLFLPCKHAVCCKECSDQLLNCPICKAFIQSKMRIYIN